VLIELPNILDAAQLQVAQEIIAKGEFIDGKQSAGQHAMRHKNNQELDENQRITTPLNNLVMGALIRHPVYLNAGLPKFVSAPRYCRYQTGMRYGSHIDDPIMGQGEQYRCDVAITVFLNSPQEYQGGELEIATIYGPQSVKLDAGDGVMYPASSLHKVNQVSTGERLVAVTWMQSWVPETERRELLYQLYLAKEDLSMSAPDEETTQKVNQSYLNLVRMWSRL
jgi:PKHD-type hydroxylase